MVELSTVNQQDIAIDEVTGLPEDQMLASDMPTTEQQNSLADEEERGLQRLREMTIDMDDGAPAQAPTDEEERGLQRLREMTIDLEEGASAPVPVAEKQKPLVSGVNIDAPQTPDEIAAVDELNVQQETLGRLAETFFSPEEIQTIKAKGPYTITEGFDAAAASAGGSVVSATAPYGGVAYMKNALKVKELVERQNAGGELSSSETQEVNTFMRNYIEYNLRGVSVGGQVVSGLAQMPAFIFEFLAPTKVIPGLGVTKAAAQPVVKKTIMEALKQTTAKGVAKGAAKIGARTLVTDLPYQKYADLRLNDFMSITDRGEVIFKESTESPLKSALKAYVYSYGEALSEVSGPALGKLISPLTGRMKSALMPMFDKLPSEFTSALYKAYKEINPNAKMSDFFSRVGWNGALEELGEERINDLWSGTTGALLGDVKTFDQYLDTIVPDKDQLLVEAGIISVAGTTRSGLSFASNVLEKKYGMSKEKAQEALGELSPSEIDEFIDSQISAPTSSYPLISDAITLDEAESLVPPVEAYDINFADGEIVTQEVFDAETPPPLDPITAAQAQKETDKLIMPFATTAKALKDYVKSVATKEAARAEKQAQQETDLLGAPVTKKTMDLRPRPVKAWIKSKGFIQRGSDAFKQLIDAGLPKSYVNDISRANGKITGLDNIPASEFNDALSEYELFANESGDGGYVDLQWLKDEMANEVGNPRMTPDMRQKQERQDELSRLKDQVSAHGVDIENADIRTIAKAIYDESEDGLTDKKIIEAAKAQNARLNAKELIAVRNAVNNGADIESAVESVLEREYSSDADIADGIPLFGALVDIEAANEVIKEESKKNPVKIDNNISTWNRFYSYWVNKYQPLKLLKDLAKKRGASLNPWEDPELVARMHASAVVKAQGFLNLYTSEFNQQTGNYEITGKSLKAVLDDFDNTFVNDEPSSDQRQEDFNDYLVARRYIEDLSQKDIKITDEQKAKSIADMTRLAAKYGKKFKFFDVFAEEVYEYQRRVLKLLVSSGNINQDAYDAIVLANPNYVPFQRVFDEVDAEGEFINNKVFSAANADKVIKEIVGSEKEVKFVFESIIKNTYKIHNIASRNQVALTISRMSKYAPEYVQYSQKSGADTITVFDKGVKKYYKVSAPMLKMMNSFNPSQLGWLDTFFAIPRSLFTAATTLTPEFIASSVIREAHSSAILSGGKIKPNNIARGFLTVVSGGNNDLYKSYVASGGKFGHSYMELDDKNLEKTYQELLENKQGKYWKYANPIRALAKIGSAADKIPRVSMYDAVKRAGGSDFEAALAARDLYDYTRGGGGAAAVLAQRYLPFFRSGIQSADKLVRAAKANPKAFTLYGLATITLPSFLLTGYYLYGAPDDEREEYFEFTELDRARFWLFKSGGEWRKIPKPFAPGYIFGTTIEDTMIWSYKGDKPEMRDFWFNYAKGALSSVSPIGDPTAFAPLPPLVKTAVEIASNHDFFTGREIYPKYLDDLQPEFRYTKQTSETAKELGKILNISPALIDKSVKGALGGGERYVADAGNKIFELVQKWNNEPVPEGELTNSDTILLRAFTPDNPAGYRSQSSRTFFDNFEEAKQAYSTYNEKQGRFKNEDERDAFYEANFKKIDAYDAMRESRNEINELGKQITELEKDTEMSAQEKTKEIADLERQITEIARMANKQYAEDTLP